MMVEDEFLDVAKSFTRHVHLAEYEKLKEMIKVAKAVARPVVSDAQPSEERRFRIRAQDQAKA
jgi:hypothetical protein